ncbi:hypothetical protein GCM10010329_53270 [Streptomyces spiroverticillatus]|uniref:Methyltransferase n=1 Tax=Streptomyces finlayi TaxID=67296 RepID=A0A919CCR1_9ACTN|nr:hypothetical protein GCM10010329_53270 [Streptomyces spiroverticillatus]GHD04739.1 hypothetical protein GCM10010334_54200 [Streptomyces finlayi]
MLAGHVGEEGVRRPRQAYGGHPVSYTSHLLPPPRLIALLRGAGFALDTQIVDEPAEGATRTHATFLAHRPA